MKISIMLSLLLLGLSSCSWLERMEHDLVGNDDKPKNAKASKRRDPVSREKYDELLAKYENLNREHQALKEGKASDPLVNDLKDTPVITNQGVETVDAFGNTKMEPVIASTTVDASNVESQLNQYRQGLSVKVTQPSDAMKIFQALAADAIPSIKVRAQLQMGEILMGQSEFDLALQAFEVIITKMAHSGTVLEALKNAALCADKLGANQKRDQYISLLRDVFQTRS